jgi:hypothetical protein
MQTAQGHPRLLVEFEQLRIGQQGLAGLGQGQPAAGLANSAASAWASSF